MCVDGQVTVLTALLFNFCSFMFRFISVACTVHHGTVSVLWREKWVEMSAKTGVRPGVRSSDRKKKKKKEKMTSSSRVGAQSP